MGIGTLLILWVLMLTLKKVLGLVTGTFSLRHLTGSHLALYVFMGTRV